LSAIHQGDTQPPNSDCNPHKCHTTSPYPPRLRVHISINRAIYFNQILNVQINLGEQIEKMASKVSPQRLKLSSELLPRRPEMAAYQMSKSKNCRSLSFDGDGDVLWSCRSAPKMTHDKFLFAALLNFICPRLGPCYTIIYPSFCLPIVWHWPYIKAHILPSSGSSGR